MNTRKGVKPIMFHLELELAVMFEEYLKEQDKTKRDVLNDLILELLIKEGKI